MTKTGPTRAQLERNARLYPLFVGVFEAHFWLPVFFLFFSQKLGLDRVLLLEAVYFAAVCVLEVPSGYFSDRVGRRATLRISATALVVAHGLFLAAATLDQGFAVFCAAQILLAVGLSFRSGTDTALLYDSLAALGRTDDYARAEAAAGRNGFLAAALAALIGGAAGAIDLRLAYVLSLMAAAGALAVVVAFVEPGPGDRDRRRRRTTGFVAQVRACAGQLTHPVLRWLFVYAVFMVVINHVPYEFYQPYLSLVASDLGGGDGQAPLVSGAHTFAVMLVAARIAARSIGVRDRLGLGPTLLGAAVLQVLIIGVMSLILHPAVVAVLALRSCPRALTTAPIRAEITPRVPRHLRATYLSLVSLVGRFAFAGLLAILPLAGAWLAASTTAHGTPEGWAALRTLLCVCLVAATAGLAGLAWTRGALRTTGDDRVRPKDTSAPAPR